MKFTIELEDKDIATIEALHDLLIDKHGYSANFITLKNERKLVDKMYRRQRYGRIRRKIEQFNNSIIKS